MKCDKFYSTYLFIKYYKNLKPKFNIKIIFYITISRI